MKITFDMLRVGRACEPQVESLGLGGVEITEHLCVQHAHLFDWPRSAWSLLNEEQKTIYYKLTSDALDSCACADDDKRPEALANLTNAGARVFYIASKS